MKKTSTGKSKTKKNSRRKNPRRLKKMNHGWRLSDIKTARAVLRMTDTEARRLGMTKNEARHIVREANFTTVGAPELSIMQLAARRAGYVRNPHRKRRALYKANDRKIKALRKARRNCGCRRGRK